MILCADKSNNLVSLITAGQTTHNQERNQNSSRVLFIPVEPITLYRGGSKTNKHRRSEGIQQPSGSLLSRPASELLSVYKGIRTCLIKKEDKNGQNILNHMYILNINKHKFNCRFIRVYCEHFPSLRPRPHLHTDCL